jgi:hypothetical protein
MFYRCKPPAFLAASFQLLIGEKGAKYLVETNKNA